MTGVVDPAEEVALAVLLGATADEGSAVVARLAEEDLLQHGVVVVAVVAAARGGDEPADALRRLAGGDPVPSGISEYELRTAAEEGEAEVAARLAAAGTPAGTAAEITQGDVPAGAVGGGPAITRSAVHVGWPGR